MKILKSKYIVIVILITIILLTQMVILLNEENKVIENYKLNISSDISKLTDVSIKNKKNVTSMLYNMLITEDVKDMMMDIHLENYEIKSDLRNELYALHKENYNFMTEVGIHQFQFHLPSTESFIRFHAPDKFGDALIDYRDSVNEVIETKKLSHGYEEGRVFGGYRYVYPIMNNNVYVGSVEFSFEMDKIIKPVESTYRVMGMLLMDEDEVKEKSFSSVKKLYVKELYTDLGYIKPSISQKDMMKRLGVEEELYISVSELLRQKRFASNDREDVFVYVRDDEKLLWLLSKPVIDVNDEVVGQLIYYKNDSVLYDMLENQDRVIRNSIVLLITSFILITMSVVFYVNVKRKATYDSLTKLYTRHAFFESVAKEIDDGVVLMIDIDDFKIVNDKYGHFVGDIILKEISDILQNNIRESDYAIRWGGEEFLVLLMCLDMETGIKRANELVKAVAGLDVDGVKTTISIGVSNLTKDYERSFKYADEALYKAKSLGKNQVYVINI